MSALPDPGRGAGLPEAIRNLSRHEAMLALCKSALVIVSETPGAWDAMPAAARERFSDAFFSLNGAERAVHDIAVERDEARDALDRAVVGLKQRGDELQALQAEVRALKMRALGKAMAEAVPSASRDEGSSRPPDPA